MCCVSQEAVLGILDWRADREERQQRTRTGPGRVVAWNCAVCVVC